MSTQTIEQTLHTWTEAPEQARSTPTVSAHAEDGQALMQAGPLPWRADLPAPLGGTNQARARRRRCSARWPADAVAEIARVWQQRCPIYLALVQPTDVAVSFTAA